MKDPEIKHNRKYTVTAVLFILGIATLHAQQAKLPLTGLLKPSEGALKKVPHAASASIPTGTTLPDSWDLSDQMPISGDQGAQGSCAAFSTVYDCLTFLQNHKSNTKPNLNGKVDSTRVYSPKYLFDKLKNSKNPPDGNCRVGVSLTDILNSVRDEGSPTIGELPYHGEDSTDCMKHYRNDNLDKLAKANSIVAWSPLYYSDITEVETNIYNSLPVIFGMEIDTDFWFKGLQAAKDHVPYIYQYNPQKDYTYHALLVVGYNKSTGLFKILNSWGPGWGTDGYFYMTFADFIRSKTEAYIAKASTTTAISPLALVSNSNTLFNFDAKGRYQGYFRLRFYKKFPKFNIGINYINKNKGEVIISVTDRRNKNLIANLILLEDETKYFSYGNQKINITFSGIEIDGISSVKNDVLLTIKISKDAPDPVIQKMLKL